MTVFDSYPYPPGFLGDSFRDDLWDSEKRNAILFFKSLGFQEFGILFFCLPFGCSYLLFMYNIHNLI